MRKVIPNDAVLVPDSASNVFKGEIFDVYQWPQALFDGSTATFEMLKRPDTVSVICVTDDKIIVLDEEQPNYGKRRNFPGGRVDDEDESIIAAGKREVLEETGYEFTDWRLVRVWQPHGKFEWFIHLLLAWNGQKTTAPHLDAGEKISLSLLSFDEVKNLVLTKAGYLGDGIALFDDLKNIEQLLGLPEFIGSTVDR